MKLLITLSIALLLTSGCDVRTAVAPTAPPKTENKVFSLSAISGSFCSSDKPKIFLWPFEKDGKALSYAEQSISRQEINKHNDDANAFGQQRDIERDAIDQKYNPLLQVGREQFTAMKCYQYCDPNAFFCNPSDTSVTYHDADTFGWATAESLMVGLPADMPVEELAKIEAKYKFEISRCQKNQEERELRQAECKSAVETKVDPLNHKSSEASFATLKAIGNKNFFDDFSEFKYSYEEGRLELSIKYGDIVFSTESETEQEKIKDVNLDIQDGFLSFTLNHIDLEDENKIIGLFKVDLEFIFSDAKGFRIDGDFNLHNAKTNSENIGRVSVPFTKEACFPQTAIESCKI